MATDYNPAATRASRNPGNENDFTARRSDAVEYDFSQDYGESFKSGSVAGSLTARDQALQDKERDLDERSLKLFDNLVKDRLVQAMKHFDEQLLKRAIEEYKKKGFSEDWKTFKIAEKKYNDIISHRERLRAARKEEHPSVQHLTDILQDITKARLDIYLKDEITKAQRLKEQLSVAEKKKSTLAMNKRTMVELKNYSSPTPVVKRIMTAALLLLGEDESTTASWAKCQSLFNPDGENGMIRRVMRFDPNYVDPSIARRVRYLLRGIELSHAERASPSAATFYVWTRKIVGSDDQDGVEDLSSSSPVQPSTDPDLESVLEEPIHKPGMKPKDLKAPELTPLETGKEMDKIIAFEKKLFERQRKEAEERMKQLKRSNIQKLTQSRLKGDEMGDFREMEDRQFGDSKFEY